LYTKAILDEKKENKGFTFGLKNSVKVEEKA